MGDPQTERKPCQVLATFDGPGSIEFQLQVQNITPNQLLFLSVWMRRKAEMMMDEIDRRKIAIPKPVGIVMPPGVEG